ncbi:MAG: peptidase domain-containing ABC transporter, partial [Prochlorococcaceae cyanobacterium]
MSLPRTLSLKQLPPFQGLSRAGLSQLEESSTRLAYRLSQPLGSRQILQDKVLLILEGEARLLGRDQGREFTLGKLTPGALVGLASLLRAAPCEEVSASSEMVVLAIPDQVILDLHQQEPSFRQWCDNTLFPAEVFALAEVLLESSSRIDIRPSAAFQVLSQHCKSFAWDGAHPPVAPEGYVLLAGSANLEGWAIGNPLKAGSSPLVRPPLPARLIALPIALLEQFLEPATAVSGSQAAQLKIGSASEATPVSEELETAPYFPAVSGAELGQYAGRAKFNLLRAKGALQETLACFQMLSAEMELPFRRDSVEKILRDAVRRKQALNLELCGGLATMLGLHVSGAKVPAEMGTRLQTPALIPWEDSFALVKQSSARGLVLASPRHGWLEITPEELPERFPEGIDVLLVDRSNTTPDQNFGISWFWPALKRYRGVLVQVFVASFVVQLFGLANPLLIQVIIDKVITQRSLDTLQILGIALVVVTIIGGVLSSLRTFLFTETTNRIDTRLGAEVIDHLLRLPLGYFDRRPVGELGSRIAELEKIRGFLTGQALTTILDALFSVIYIVVMLIYSWLLTLIALIVVPIQVALTLIGSPLFRRQIRDTAQENARTQSHLVEVLTGIQTVKAQNVEMVSRWKWQELYNRYISRTFEKTITGTALNETSQVLQSLSQLLVLWVGATLVLSGQLTLGQLIAFRIISGYVTQPLLRLSSIWQSVQELKVSFERLADIIDTPEESSEKDKANIPLPSLHGDVKFEGITFGFSSSSPPVLKNINLDIAAGTFVGVVGQSGSGKSTLMKLLPRLYDPQQGRILIDNYDISKVELYSLRRQIGIVPQDPLLFAGTVSENIALTDPDSTSDSIVRAAKIAGAYDFIMELAQGYSTDVGERGAGLSGGQKQRIAIARTLLSNPRLLV